MGKDTFVNSTGPDPFEARLGSVLADKWTLVRVLGVGGMASVYEAHHLIGRREAIKVLHPEIARQTELRQRFEQEAYAVNKLNHPGVVQIRDTGSTEDGCPFLVMELLEGASLGQRLLERSLSSNAKLDHIDELLAVLEVAHPAGIVHRDLKPDNLFITQDGTLKVLDFGIARVRATGAMKVVTQVGTALGTPHYMSPEQIKGVGVDHRTDLFAVGAILWEFLAGRDVHLASSDQELMVKMLTVPASPLASVASEVPEPICRVVDRALAFEAEDRYPDAATMRSDLRAARAGHAPPFAVAAPGSIHERATIANGVSAVPPAVPLAASTRAHPLSAPSGAQRSPIHAAAHTAVGGPHGEREGRRKPMLAIIVVGTLVGALVTMLVVSWAASDTTEDAASDDDDARSRSLRSDDDNDKPKRRTRRTARSSAPKIGTSTDRPGPVPEAERPSTPDAWPLEPQAPPPVEPQAPPPATPQAPPPATPQAPPPAPHAKKKKRRKKKKKKKKHGREDDD